MKYTPCALAALIASTLAPVALQAQTTTLDTVTVTAEAPGYAAPTTTAAPLKSDVPLLETAQAVSVIEREVIQDQGARKIEDVLKNVSGVSVGGFFGEWDYYRIRGFESGYYNSYIDGLLSEGSPNEELWGLERIEVIKGPASTLYGAGPLGGFVNITTKRPKREFGGEVSITGGAWDLYEGAIDINVPLLTPAGAPAPVTSAKGAKSITPLAESGGLGIYARLNGLYRQSNAFQDYASRERVYIAPSVTFAFGEDTTLTILASYKNDLDDLAYSLPARGTVLPSQYGQIPVTRYVGNPALGNEEWERTIRLGYEFKSKLNDHLTFRNNFRYHWLDWTSTNLSYPTDLDGPLLGLSGYKADGEYTGVRVDTALDATFETGAIEHTLTAGVDYRWTRSYAHMKDSKELVYFNVFRPNYASMAPYVYGPYYISDSEEDDLGLYLQEHAKIGNFTLTLGARYDFSSYDDTDGVSFEDEAFTPKVGLTYEIVPGIAAYANYSRSYNPQWSYTDAAGQAVQPEEGENWEAGFKFNLLDGKFTALIAAYNLTRENVATDNLGTSDPFDSIVTGEQRSRGIEFETATELLPGLQLLTAYTFIDAEITEDNIYTPSTRLQNVPEQVVNVWLKYTIQEGPLKGFGIGAGVEYNTDQAADLEDTFSLPSYAILDAALYYERDNFSAQVNFNNVLDKRHFVGSYSDLYIMPGAPFNVTASVTWKF